MHRCRSRLRICRCRTFRVRVDRWGYETYVTIILTLTLTLKILSPTLIQNKLKTIYSYWTRPKLTALKLHGQVELWHTLGLLWSTELLPFPLWLLPLMYTATTLVKKPTCTFLCHWANTFTWYDPQKYMVCAVTCVCVCAHVLFCRMVKRKGE